MGGDGNATGEWVFPSFHGETLKGCLSHIWGGVFCSATSVPRGRFSAFFLSPFIVTFVILLLLAATTATVVHGCRKGFWDWNWDCRFWNKGYIRMESSTASLLGNNGLGEEVRPYKIHVSSSFTSHHSPCLGIETAC